MLAVAGPAVDHRLDPGAGAGERFAGEAHGRISFRRSSAIVSISASAVANSRSALLSRRRSKAARIRSEEHTSELQSLMRISYAVFCLKKKKKNTLVKKNTPIEHNMTKIT